MNSPKQFNNGSDYKEVLAEAVKYLTSRSRSAKELRDYLRRKGASLETITEVISKLQSLHYLDDAKYAEQLIRVRKELSKYGSYRIKQELKTKGIAEEVIKIQRDSYNPDEEYTIIMEILAQKYKNSDNDEKTIRRAISMLARRGFQTSTIFKAIRSYFHSNLDNE